MFAYSENQLKILAQNCLNRAQQKGAHQAEVSLFETLGQGVTVRMGDIETLEYQQDTELTLTVYVGKSSGEASTSDFSERAIEQTINAAYNIAKYTGSDDCNGLADAHQMAQNIGDLDLFHPNNHTQDDFLQAALSCEKSALNYDARIVNSEGAEYSSRARQMVYANSHDFCEYQHSTRYSLYCSVLAEKNDDAQCGYWIDNARNAEDVDAPEKIGTIAAQYAIDQLGACSVKTGEYPVVFDHTVSGSIIGHLVSALSGGALYRKSSFLCDSLNKSILNARVNLREAPHTKRVFGVSYFDGDGVATKPRDIVQNGTICSYFLGSYSARKLGLISTGNAGGVHRLELQSDCASQKDLLNQMGTGLLVTDLMGSSVNLINGNYSRGASGFWVQNGVIAYPVKEITIASTLQNMFADIQGIADDALVHSRHQIGSILIGKMTVAAQ